MRTTDQQLRDDSTAARRLAGWSGIAFVVAFVAGFVLVAQVPAYDDPDAVWVEWVTDSGDRIPAVVGTLILSAAGLLLMAFTTTLSAVLQRAADGDERGELGILRGAGIIGGAALLFAALIGGAMSAGVTFAPEFEAPSADVIRALDQLSIAFLLIGTGWSVAVVIACASRAAARSGALPGWLVTAGYVFAVALLASVLFLPILLLPAWVLVTGVVLLRPQTA